MAFSYHVMFTFVMNESMKRCVSESLLWKQEMYNSGTNNVFFVVLQFLVICGNCYVTRDYCGRNLTTSYNSRNNCCILYMMA